jgi:tetratricopeptide (TPR) repeat protein
MSEFRQIVIENARQFGRVLVFVDVCHSGNIGKRELPTSESIQQQLSGNGTGLLMAATLRKPSERDAEFAYESPTLGHGIFSYYLVRELNGNDPQLLPQPDSQIHFQELVARVVSEVPKATGYKQSPVAAAPVPQKLPVVPKPGEIGISPWTEIGDRNEGIQLRRRGKTKTVAAPLTRLPVPRGQNPLEEAQQVIATYVRGEETPQNRVDFERAAALFRQAWQTAPDQAFTESRMLFCEGRALLFRQPGQDRLAQGTLASARKLLERSILIDPTRAYSYNALGMAYLESTESDPLLRGRDYDQAIQAFTDANRFAPYWAYPVHNLALTYEQKGDYEAAIQMYREAMRVASWASYPVYNLGLLLAKLNRIGEAREEFLRAITIAEEPVKRDPKAQYRWARLSDGYNALATLEVNEGRFRLSRRYLKRALDLDPANPLARHNQALLDAGPNRKPARAIDTWRDLLTTGANLTFQLSLARTLAAVQRFDEAAREYESIVASHPELAAAWHNLALVYVKARQPTEAVSAVQRGLAAQPSDPQLRVDAGEVERIAAGASPRTSEFRSAISRKARKD